MFPVTGGNARVKPDARLPKAIVHAMANFGTGDVEQRVKDCCFTTHPTGDSRLIVKELGA